MARRNKTKTPRLPRRHKVRGVEYKIAVARSLHEHGEGTLGYSNSLERIMKVWAKASPAERWQILWHELAHQILAQAGIDEILGRKTEEAVVLAFEHAWDDVREFCRKADGRPRKRKQRS